MREPRRVARHEVDLYVERVARALLAEPDLINRIAADGAAHSLHSACTHCNQCMPTIYSRTRCTVTGAPDATG